MWPAGSTCSPGISSTIFTIGVRASQTCAQTLIHGNAEIFVDCRTAHVRINQQNFFPGLSQHHRQIH